MYTNNPCSTWIKVNINSTPYVLSIFNEEIYNPKNYTNYNTFYNSDPGLFEPNYNYSLISVDDGQIPNGITIGNSNGIISFVGISNGTYNEKVFVSKGTTPYYYAYNFNTFLLTQNSNICFKEGTKILRLNKDTNNSEYIEIQKLRKGDLVKTVSSGYKKISLIGYSKIYHNANIVRSKNKLYKCSKYEYPELFEDLVITGCHSILVENFKNEDEEEKTLKLLGDIYITDDYYRLPACIDERTSIYEIEGEYTIWNFALENNNNYYNYGIYANGLLVESTSIRMMKELSGMKII